MTVSVAPPILPPRLHAGDTVGVCAPAGPVEESRLDAGIAALESKFRVRMDRPGVLAKHGYFAGSDEHRVDQINGLLRDPEVRAIFLARGGYGITRILDALDREALQRDPVPIVGFSDGTALLCWAQTCAGISAVHGPVIGQLGELAVSDFEHLFALLTAADPLGTVASGLDAVGADTPTEFSGRLVGGNLSLLSCLVGTGYMPTYPDMVLLLEEVGERPYAVDRMMTHLASAGVFENVRGVVVGDFERCEETKHEGPEVLDVISERLRAFGLPGVRFPGIGHGAANVALPLGVRCAVRDGAFCIDEPAVS